ncbi:hypothetical protein GCM10018793_09320 [Streptomyces sulfonofaciens]|uniref:Uncharacterized protein n=1 Tax=Streptomyces sulfonofaciens TaxID=68272 RepID=A0A919FTN6_9ACTN|nr:hypothetical protein [Streptomyces sulfonofaciens]GHH72397.1 hypothetical protein GCM10018793_09320 [Streptomyces sulfonofaciens]
MRAIAGLWRWRHNPLRRATDLLEAWVALTAAVLIVAAAPLAGVVTGTLSEQALLRSVQQQHRERHATTATVVRTVRRPPLDTDPETVSARDAHSRVIASWRAPDGRPHTGGVVADLKSPRVGDRFPVWTDRHGRLMARPLDPIAASTHAALAGCGAAAAFAALVEAGRRLVLWRIVRRRYARWDRAWEKAGPDWGRTGTGS